MTDLEVGRFGLRSFRFARNPATLSVPWGSSDQAMNMSYGEWVRHHQRTAGAQQQWVWESPSFPHGDDWVDGTCSAVCRRGSATGHEAPDENCHCGIYASLSYADLLKSFTTEARRMVAVIAAEGVTIIGDRGLRTQFARVVGFWVNESRAFDEGHPTRTAQEQFTDAEQFGDPLSLVEKFGIALLPPPEPKVPTSPHVLGQRLRDRLRDPSEKFWSGRFDE